VSAAIAMVHYKLIYFNGRGLAEVTRLLFAVGEAEYEDFRIERNDWDARKAEVNPPFGQLPILEVDGVRICQSSAINRFLANKFNLAGKTELEKAQVDMIVDCFVDAFKPAIAIFYEPDETKKGPMKKKYFEEQLPGYLKHLEALLTHDYFVGNELTWPDLVFYNFNFWATNFSGGVNNLANFPKLAALYQKVESTPKVAEWVAKRPVTEF